MQCRRKAPQVAGLAVALVSLVASSANASTVAVRASSASPGFPASPAADELAVVGAPGEQNRIDLRPVPDASGALSWMVSDAGAVLTPGESCRRVDEHSAQCGARPGRFAPGLALVTLGDLNDAFSISVAKPSDAFNGGVIADGGDGNDLLSGWPGASELRGGAGDDRLLGGFGGSPFGDTLEGGPGNDQLIGGPGSDRLHGGGGHDEIRGGPGNDTLSDGDRDDAFGDARPGPDTLDGGDGDDRVSYQQRRAAVVVNLADGHPAGERGEADILSGVESIVGGRGDDRLTGDRGANSLDGGGGQNRLSGGGGSDLFEHAHGSVFCGSGDDRVVGGRDSRDYPQPDCEVITPDFDQSGISPYPEVRHGRLSYAFSCFRDVDDDDGSLADPVCAVTLHIREASGGHRSLARGRLRRGHWDRRKVRVRLTARGRRLATRRRGVLAVVRLKESGQHSWRWTIRLRLRR
jgi:hypothetical protein